jgi:hypothetical protein
LRAARTPYPLRILFDIVGKPAEFIRDVWRALGQIAQTIGGFAQELGQIFVHVRGETENTAI